MAGKKKKYSVDLLELLKIVGVVLGISIGTLGAGLLIKEHKELNSMKKVVIEHEAKLKTLATIIMEMLGIEDQDGNRRNSI